MEPNRHLDVLRRGVNALLDGAVGGIDRAVPACPGWAVADLVAHAGTSWGWVARVVSTRRQADFSEAPEKLSEAALLGWAREHADRLLDVLGAVDPDSDCWTVGLPRACRFWFRRQALETTLHAYDVQTAIGSVRPLTPEVAADGVDEFLSVMIPLWMIRNPNVWHGQTVALQRTDGEGAWVVHLGPDGNVGVERSHGEGDVVLRGSASALWLWCWNRASMKDPDLELLGDPDIAARWTSSISM